MTSLEGSYKIDDFNRSTGRWGGEGVSGFKGIKVDPPFKIFIKLVNKNAIKPEKGIPSFKFLKTPIYPSP